MTSTEIYNTYLGVSRRARNQPWKPRKDFNNFDSTPDGTICKRLEFFFKKFPQITVQDFFNAPYVLYKDETHFPLSFYTTQKAIAAYSALQKQRKEELPDTESQIADIKKSLKYIAIQCVSKNITLEEYCTTKKGYIHQPFLDFLEKRVNIYVLLKLPFFDTQLNSYNLQDREIFLKDVYNNLSKYKMRLNTSNRANSLINEGLKIITKSTTLKTNTTNTK